LCSVSEQTEKTSESTNTKEKVKVAMTLPKRDQKAAFDNFRPEGVLKTNIVEAGKV